MSGAAGDWNGDGHPDIVWQNNSTCQFAVWYMGGARGNEMQAPGWINSAVTPGWKVVALADVDGDGRSDVIWQNDSTRQVAVWYLGGPKGNEFRSFGWISSNGEPGWGVVAVRDLDGNDKPDIVWQNDITWQVAVWYMGGGQGNEMQSLGWINAGNSPGWRVAGVSDLDGNGKLDVIWQHDTTRR